MMEVKKWSYVGKEGKEGKLHRWLEGEFDGMYGG